MCCVPRRLACVVDVDVQVYQKGVINPMVNIELFWRSYDDYEHKINPLIAKKKMTHDRSRDHVNARRVGKELEVRVLRVLSHGAPLVMP